MATNFVHVFTIASKVLYVIYCRMRVNIITNTTVTTYIDKSRVTPLIPACTRYTRPANT